MRASVVTLASIPSRSTDVAPSVSGAAGPVNPRGGFTNRQVSPCALNTRGSPGAMTCTSYPSE